MAEHDQTVGRIIRRNADANAVAYNDANVKSAHFAAELCIDDNGVIQLNFVDAARKRIHDFTI